MTCFPGLRTHAISARESEVRSVASHQPNILIFMVDHGQSSVFGGQHPAITPNTTRVAAEGIRFTEAYCPAAHCCPSRASFMTGLMPSQHGIYNNVSNSSAINRGLAEGAVPFSEHLAGAGYDLRYCGKWHVSDLTGPKDHGWREHYVTSNRDASRERAQDRWWRGGEEGGGTGARERGWGELVTPGWGGYRLFSSIDPGEPPPADERVVGAAVESLSELCGRNDPWCLFVGPIGPHDPYRVPKRFVDRYDLSEIVLPESYRDSLRDKPNVYRRLREHLWSQLSEEEYKDAVRHYWAYCTYEDELFGQLLDLLEERHRVDDTVVVFLSDHGDYAGAHGLFLKGVPAFREAYNIPAIVRWPAGVSNPGREVDALVSLADFAPTFLELARADGGKSTLAGSSLVPFFSSSDVEAWRSSLDTQFNGVELLYTQRAVITKRWKFVYNGFDFDELYDRAADPSELKNLAQQERYADMVGKLSQEMWRLADCHEDWMISNRYTPVRLARRGPALGYGDVLELV